MLRAIARVSLSILSLLQWQLLAGSCRPFRVTTARKLMLKSQSSLRLVNVSSVGWQNLFSIANQILGNTYEEELFFFF
jgi:hypothetical protein